MPKLEITDVQIDNFNETVDKLNKFESGLNIICGANEIGKSTLMSFIKNIFIREKSEGKGYIKCSVDGKDIKLYANKTKLKENEPYLENITAHSFKTGFIIDLDDLVRAKKSDSDELVNTIKDSSGNAVNEKESEYKDYIYGKKQNFALTGTNKPSKPFEQQFNYLKEIDNKIKELQLKEEDYNKACAELEQTEKEIDSLSRQYEYSKILYEKEKILDESQTIKINKILAENKEQLETIRETYGALNAVKQNIHSLNNKLEEYKNIYSEKIEELNRIEPFDSEKLSKFQINPEDLKISKILSDKSKELKNESEQLNRETQACNDRIETIDFELNNIRERLDKLEIKNIEDYTNDLLLIENHLSNYCKLADNMRKDGEICGKDMSFDYSLFFTLLFGGILFASIGALIQHFHESVRYMLILLILVSISGISTAVMQKFQKKSVLKNSYTKELEQSKSTISQIVKKHCIEECSDENFIVRTNCSIDKMKEAVNEYKTLSNEISRIENDKKKEENEITKCSEKLAFINKSLDDTNKEISEFLERVYVSDILNYPEIYEYIRDINIIKTKTEETETELDNIRKLTDKFVELVNNFINECRLENIQTLNKYEPENFEGTLKSIQERFEKNLSDNRLKTELEEKIKKYNNELEKFDEEIKTLQISTDEEYLKELDEDLQKQKEQRALYKKEIETLSQAGSLVELKNKKNAEINRLKNIMDNLIVKEIVYNVIRNSKEKFNEIQPNLVSAEKYLAKITNNKYTKIDFENRNISGENTKEKDWDILSRGTKEQLYLALRLGFANNYSKDREGNPNGLPNLPLIIDDAFVNFDYDRTKSVLKCLEEFSKTNQVLFFTCHTELIQNILKDEKITHSFMRL